MALGPNLLTGGDFEASSGVGAASVLVGPLTDYIICGPNLFAAPCGAQRLALFDTNAGQVTGGTSSANSIARQGSRSMAANVSGNLNARLVYWNNIQLVNGATYRASLDIGMIFAPFALALRIDGVRIAQFPATGLVAGVWARRSFDFVWTGTTGPHTVAFTSDDGTAGGNDHAFDNFSLRMVTPSRGCGCQRPAGCQELGAPDWFTPFPPAGNPNWQISVNSGATWVTANAGYSHGPTASGVHRWRHLFTVPNGYRGRWRITINGDKSDSNTPANFGSFWMDGQLIDTNTEIAYVLHRSPWIAVSPGAHIFEWREGQLGTGDTVPIFGVEYDVTCLPGF